MLDQVAVRNQKRSFPMSETVILYDLAAVEGGHRADYAAALGSLFHLEPCSSLRRAVLTPHPVLVPMIEDSPTRYLAACVIRALMGRRTVGIMFRPLPVIQSKKVRHRAKRFIFRALKCLRTVTTLTILPFHVQPEFNEIADDWIYDLQFWDVHYTEAPHVVPPDPDIGNLIRDEANGRKVICALGPQDFHKGFDRFVELFSFLEQSDQDLFFVSAGRVGKDWAQHAALMNDRGGMVIDRYLTNAELFGLYENADLIWASYAPTYDQASGVFGRALQYGIPPIVRSGSLLHRFCLGENLAHIAYDGRPETFPTNGMPGRDDPAVVATRSHSWGKHTASRLRHALGLNNEAS